MTKQKNEVSVKAANNLRVVQSAIATMTVATLNEYNDIRKRAEDLTKADLLTKHHIGVRINAVLADSNKYGESAVGKLAVALNVSKDYLYKLKHVSTVWTQAELQEIIDVSAGDNAKMPLTYSHLEILASIPKKSKREKLLNKTMANWLTVQQLIELVREELGVRRQNTGPRMPKTTSAALNKLDTMSSKLLDYAPVFHKAIKENFNEKEVDQALLKSLDETIAEQRKLLETVKSVCSELEVMKDKAIRLSAEMAKKTSAYLVDHSSDALEAEVVDEDEDEFYDDVVDVEFAEVEDSADEDDEEDPDNYVYFDSRGKVKQ